MKGLIWFCKGQRVLHSLGAHSIIISFHKIDGALIIIIIYLFFCAFVILGAGGLVINEKNQVLAVCEKYRRKQHWKLPGGTVDRGLYEVNAIDNV